MVKQDVDTQFRLLELGIFLTSIQNIVNEDLGLFKPKFFSSGQAYTTSWSSKYDVQKWYEYLYKDATIWLDRKYENFQIFLDDYKLN